MAGTATGADLNYKTVGFLSTLTVQQIEGLPLEVECALSTGGGSTFSADALVTPLGLDVDASLSIDGGSTSTFRAAPHDYDAPLRPHVARETAPLVGYPARDRAPLSGATAPRRAPLIGRTQ